MLLIATSPLEFDDFPRAPSGKIKKAELRAQLAQP